MKSNKKSEFIISTKFRQRVGYDILVLIPLSLFIFYFKINPTGFIWPILILSLLLMLYQTEEFIVKGNECTLYRKRIFGLLKSKQSFKYELLKSVHFVEEEWSWIRILIPFLSVYKSSELIFHTNDGTSKLFRCGLQKEEVRKAISIISSKIIDARVLTD